MLYGITKMRVGSMLNVYVICNNALVHKQYVIANSTERVQYSVSEFRVIVIMIIWWLTYFLNSD
ncbi:hypothetical protein A8P07_11525 [Salmonella enterica subsp. enterica serovar Typhimurium]|nr:hypothetical protein [Salmonella enterica subsp. enterica serovar Typhimurium]